MNPDIMLPDEHNELWGRLWRRMVFLILCGMAFSPLLVSCVVSAPLAQDNTGPKPMPERKGADTYKDQLTPDQYYVCFEEGTERAFTGKYWDTKTPGTYHCVACNAELFRSDDKYDSGSGWPSFTQPSVNENVAYTEDKSLFMVRTEVHCSNCEAHLGHVFDDGPAPTGQRYCINSAALNLVPDEAGTGSHGSAESPAASGKTNRKQHE